MRNLILTILFLGGGLVSAQDLFVKKVTVIGAVENIESVKFSEENIGIGTSSPNALLDVRGIAGASVGGFPSGSLHITSSSASVNANAVITGHNLFGGNKQLWYFGSSSGSNDNIIAINRQNGSFSFGTNATTRLTIASDGNITATSFFTAARLTADNLQLDGNTISATNLNGDLILDAFTAGTGVVKITDQLEIEGSTSQLLLTDTDGDNTYILKSNLSDFSIVEIGGNNVFKIKGGAAVNSLDINSTEVTIGTKLIVDNLSLDGNTVSSTDVNGNINLSPNGTGDVIVNSVLETVGGNNGSVGGFSAGNLMVRSSGTGVNASANITGHNSFGGNKQLWFLGSISSSNDDITFINRQTGSLTFFTSNALAVTIESGGRGIFEQDIQIKGGGPGAGKVLTSDAVGVARWETPSVVGVTEANFFSATDNTTQTVAVANTFQTITFATNDELDGWTHTAGTDAFTCNQTGKYRGSVIIQFQKTGGASSLAEFRLTINGVPAGSGHTFVQDLITNNEIKLLTATNIVSLTSGDVVRFEFTSNTTTTEIVLPVTTGANPVSIVAAFDRIQ